MLSIISLSCQKLFSIPFVLPWQPGLPCSPWSHIQKLKKLFFKQICILRTLLWPSNPGVLFGEIGRSPLLSIYGFVELVLSRFPTLMNPTEKEGHDNLNKNKGIHS